MQDTLGKYQLAEHIASGGMADVYRAFMTGPGGFRKTVAIKQIRKHLSEEPEFVDMFMNEATLAARLDHPNIVQVFEFNRDRNQYYLVMEFISGLDLKSAQEAIPGPWSPQLVLFMASKILAGLQYAHELCDASGRPMQVIHRDISPHNILLSVNGEVKLADFGIARLRDAVSHTHANMVRGKLPYLSPEQARGELIDARSDLFSLGLVMWELLTGFRRYRDIPRRGMGEVMAGNFEAPGVFLSDADPRLDELMYRFLAPHPADRFPSASVARQELERLFPWDATSTLAQLISANVRKPVPLAAESTILLARDVASATWGFDERNQERPTTLMDMDLTLTQLDDRRHNMLQNPACGPLADTPHPVCGNTRKILPVHRRNLGRMTIRVALFLLLAMAGMGMGFAGVRAFDRRDTNRTGLTEPNKLADRVSETRAPHPRIRMVGGQFESRTLYDNHGTPGEASLGAPFTETVPSGNTPRMSVTDPPRNSQNRTTANTPLPPLPGRTVRTMKKNDTAGVPPMNPPTNPTPEPEPSARKTTVEETRNQPQRPSAHEEELKVIAEWE